jgi:hypothetical protein
MPHLFLDDELHLTLAQLFGDQFLHAEILDNGVFFQAYCNMDDCVD